MSKNFHEHFEADHGPLPSERSTGLVFAAVGLIVAVVFRASPAVWMPAIAAAVGFGLISLTAPALLGPLNRAWFRFALLLNKVMSPLIMGVLFAITIIPFGLAMQLKRDPLRRRRTTSNTYWIDREKPATPPSMTQQF